LALVVRAATDENIFGAFFGLFPFSWQKRRLSVRPGRPLSFLSRMSTSENSNDEGSSSGSEDVEVDSILQELQEKEAHRKAERERFGPPIPVKSQHCCIFKKFDNTKGPQNDGAFALDFFAFGSPCALWQLVIYFIVFVGAIMK
jgi:hypothetical protein